MSSSHDAAAGKVNVYLGGGKPYDPDAPVPYWHQRMELATICVVNSLSRERLMLPTWTDGSRAHVLQSLLLSLEFGYGVQILTASGWTTYGLLLQE